MGIFDGLQNKLYSNKNNIAKLEKELYKELKLLGFDFHYANQFNCETFTKKDKLVVPILIKYIEQFDDEGYRLQYLSSLGVKGFDNATEYLITQYRKNWTPNYKQRSLNVISQTLARVCDLRFLDTYLEFLSKDVTIDACYLVQMIGNMKVDRAIPYLIKLLDCVAIIPQHWEASPLENQKYFVSQSAIKALGNYGNPNHIKYIKKFLSPEQLDWINFSESKDKKYLLKSTYKEYKLIAKEAINKMDN